MSPALWLSVGFLAVIVAMAAWVAVDPRRPAMRSVAIVSAIDPEVAEIISLISRIEAGERICVSCSEPFLPVGPGNCVCPECKAASAETEWRTAA